MYDLYLEHHGIKGMKWGVRRYQNKDGSLTAAGKKRARKNWSEDAIQAKKIKKKSVHSMSNSELQTLNKRMELESKYHQLNPSVVKKGLKFVGAVAGGMGTVLALRNNSKQLIDIGKKVFGG